MRSSAEWGQDGGPSAGLLSEGRGGECVIVIVLRYNRCGVQNMLLRNYSVFHFVFYASSVRFSQSFCQLLSNLVSEC